MSLISNLSISRETEIVLCCLLTSPVLSRNYKPNRDKLISSLSVFCKINLLFNRLKISLEKLKALQKNEKNLLCFRAEQNHGK